MLNRVDRTGLDQIGWVCRDHTEKVPFLGTNQVPPVTSEGAHTFQVVLKVIHPLHDMTVQQSS